jgi:hypothetical protein
MENTQKEVADKAKVLNPTDRHKNAPEEKKIIEFPLPDADELLDKDKFRNEVKRIEEKQLERLSKAFDSFKAYLDAEGYHVVAKLHKNSIPGITHDFFNNPQADTVDVPVRIVEKQV